MHVVAWGVLGAHCYPNFTVLQMSDSLPPEYRVLGACRGLSAARVAQARPSPSSSPISRAWSRTGPTWALTTYGPLLCMAQEFQRFCCRR